MKGSKFVFDCVYLMYYRYQKKKKKTKTKRIKKKKVRVVVDHIYIPLIA